MQVIIEDYVHGELMKYAMLAGQLDPRLGDWPDGALRRPQARIRRLTWRRTAQPRPERPASMAAPTRSSTMPTTSSWWARAAPACGAALGAAGAGLKTACITKVFPRMQVELHEVEAEHRLFGDAPPHLLRRLSRLEIDRESEKEAGTGQLSRVDPAPQPPSPLEIAAGIAYGGDALRQPVPGLLGSHDCMLMEIDEARQGDAALRLEDPGSGRQPPAGRPGTLDHTRPNMTLCARDRRTGAACEQGGARAAAGRRPGWSCARRTPCRAGARRR
jgi:hypothetical protein